MDLFNLREPVSAWSHAAWLLLTLPGALLLWRRAVGDRVRQLVLLTYTLCLALCALASTLYHAVRVPDDQLAAYLLCDHIGIYLLIAGTYTPVAWTMMTGHWRRGTLAITWLGAALGAWLHAAVDDLPNWLTTGLYLAMGWGSLICYLELNRNVSHRVLRPIVLGGAVYSVGALFHLTRWPVVWPGVVEAHEVFHGLVVVGSVLHYRFMLRVIAPWGRDPVDRWLESAPRPVAAPPLSVAPVFTRRATFGGPPPARAWAWAWALARPADGPGRRSGPMG